MYFFRRKPIFIWLFIVLFTAVPGFSFARIGVGVGLGKIDMEKPFEPGGIYEIPSIPVINTGDETSEYEVGIEYHQDQPQLLPAREWFNFEPAKLTLKPGEVGLVKISLTLPIKTAPGDYFAYIEGRALRKQGTGTRIGVAAAGKLYFTVSPATGWQGLMLRLSTLYKKYSPWPQVLAGVIAVAGIFLLLRRFFSFNIQRKGPKNSRTAVKSRNINETKSPANAINKKIK